MYSNFKSSQYHNVIRGKLKNSNNNIGSFPIPLNIYFSAIIKSN